MTPLTVGLLLLLQVAAPGIGRKTTIYAELRNELSSKFSHVGQRVQMVALEDVKAEDGTVAIPKGAKLTGKVTAVQKHRNDQPAILAFALDRATWKRAALDFSANVESLELMKTETMAASEPSLGRAPGTTWGGGEEKRPPADCSVEKASTPEENTKIVCRERDVDMGPGGRVYLVMVPAPKA